MRGCTRAVATALGLALVVGSVARADSLADQMTKAKVEADLGHSATAITIFATIAADPSRTAVAPGRGPGPAGGRASDGGGCQGKRCGLRERDEGARRRRGGHAAPDPGRGRCRARSGALGAGLEKGSARDRRHRPRAPHALDPVARSVVELQAHPRRRQGEGRVRSRSPGPCDTPAPPSASTSRTATCRTSSASSRTSAG